MIAWILVGVFALLAFILFLLGRNAYKQGYEDGMTVAQSLPYSIRESLGLRDVFETARRKVGLREGCTYDQVIERLEAL